MQKGTPVTLDISRTLGALVRKWSQRPYTIDPWTTRVWPARVCLYTFFPSSSINSVRHSCPRASHTEIQPTTNKTQYFCILNLRFATMVATAAADQKQYFLILNSRFSTLYSQPLIENPCLVESSDAKVQFYLRFWRTKSYTLIFRQCP